MTISTNKTGEVNSTQTGGAIADALTILRVVLTPIIMGVIILGWPLLDMAVLASFLFIVAAITDFMDDYFGGTENAPNRKFGWVDDIADVVLVTGTLAAMVYVIHRDGFLEWTLAVPAFVIIVREIVVGLFKGYEMTKSGWPETKYGSLKNGLCMLGTCLLLAAPWLTAWIDRLMANSSNSLDVLVGTSPYVWLIGQGVLWFAAVVSVITGLKLLRTEA